MIEGENEVGVFGDESSALEAFDGNAQFFERWFDDLETFATGDVGFAVFDDGLIADAIDLAGFAGADVHAGAEEVVDVFGE